MALDRRSFLTALGASVGSAALGPAGGSDDDLTFLLWAGGSELAAFRAAARDFHAAEGVRVHLRTVAWDRLRSAVDATLDGPLDTTPDVGRPAGRVPDLVRLPYTDLAAHGSRGVLRDLSDVLGPGAAYRPGPLRAVTSAGAPFGVPHTVDTSLLLVRTDASRAAGIALPPSAAEAWDRDQLDEALVRLAGVAGAGRHATGVNWQGAGAFRWLNFLGQGGGRLLTEDLSRSAVDGPAGLAALRWTGSLFTRGLVPATTSTRGRPVGGLFAAGRLASVFAGGFLLPSLARSGVEFAATSLPRGPGVTAELGGAAVAAVAGSPRGEQAERFLRFLASPEQVGRFCAATGALPARTDVPAGGLACSLRPDLVEVLEAQADGIPDAVVAQTTVPAFPALHAVLGEQLERVFVGGAAADDVLADLATAVDRVLRG